VFSKLAKYLLRSAKVFFVRSSKYFFVRFCEFCVTIFEHYNLMETHFVTQFDTQLVVFVMAGREMSSNSITGNSNVLCFKF
jgi:hypothetical protein